MPELITALPTAAKNALRDKALLPRGRTTLIRATAQAVTGTFAGIGWSSAVIDELSGVWAASPNPSRLYVPAGCTKARFRCGMGWANVTAGVNYIRLTKNGTVHYEGDIQDAINEAATSFQSKYILGLTPGTDYFELQVATSSNKNTAAAADWAGGNVFIEAEWFA